ncbi:putative nonribosomal peptide [Diaporthe ampelina]|uniref:Putative nonribosomal peptide n=1 Tax=Diaporthe ampelina TaxID=1214573 RepID=A0A0G2H3I1_9PEZI|nr:putative nonribosomal peptide [Diaporthe ampelina]
MKHVVYGGGPNSSHWNEFNFIDVGHKMEEVEPGLFELVYPNTELTRRCQLHFHSYPELSEYRTKDLFAPVPGKDGWWTYRGRTDNWVIMSNALKMDPTDIESTVGSHPDVRGVLVAGDRRYRLCLLVELKDDAIPATNTEREDALAKLWPSIEEANKRSSKFGRIPRELVFFATPSCMQKLNKAFSAQHCRVLKHGIEMDDDLLAAGIDSFGIMAVASRLKAALRQHGVSEASLSVVSVKTLYSASTIRSLADSLAGALSTSGQDITSDGGLEDDGSDILAFIQKYKAAVQQLVENAPAAGEVDAKKRGESTHCEADLSNETLGLSPNEYAFVTRETTVIVHNAYPVNFLLNLAQFEPHLRGLLNLMALALNARASLLFVSSISTAMSASGRRQRVPEVVLDTATQVDDLLPQGYAQSKYVCEKMLEAFADGLAARSAPTEAAQPVGVLRVGQICGPRFGRGPWNKWEWFPSLVMSSRFLGVAPDGIGQEINWIPVDELACIVTELISCVHLPPVNGEPGRQQSNPLQVFNVVNPKVSSWKDVLPALQREVPETIPVCQWVGRLEESVDKSTYVLDQNPGAKLVAFYQGALLGDGSAEPLYEVESLVQASATAARLGPVTQADLERWMEVWL